MVTAIQASGPPKASEAHLSIHLLKVREWLSRRVVTALWWVDTRDMAADGLTKGRLPRETIIAVCEKGRWDLSHECMRVPASAPRT